jgi:hypothetical protein
MTLTREDVFIKMVLDAWFSKLNKAGELFDHLPDDMLLTEVAPGRSRGIYLLGHLTAVHDRMIPLLGFGEAMHPGLYDIFVTQPDKAVPGIPSTTFLRNGWKEVTETIKSNCSNLSAEEWFLRHNAVSDTDFAKEPHRNKLNLIINRTNHLDYHLGQLAFLKK